MVSADIKDANITTAKIGDAQITTAKIGLLQVTSATIADATIGTAKIADAQITNAKIDLASVNKLIVQSANIADASILTAKIADAQITYAKIGALAVQTANIADAVITTAKIGLLQVTSAVIADATIGTAKIGDAQITNAKIDRASVNKLVVVNADIGDLAVGTAEIALLAVKTAQIDALAVTTAKIALLAVTTGLIANAAIGTAQIADASITDLKVVAVSAGELTAGTIDTKIVTVQGQNGKLRIVNNRLQVFDAQATPIERVSVGDVNGDGTAYGFRVRSADGLTTLLDENGVHPEGITDGSILNSKISDSANINGTKLLDASLMGDKLVANAITTREMHADSVGANEIIALSITASELATDSIIARNIKAGEVTFDKVNLKGMVVSNANGIPTLSINPDGSMSMAGNAKSYNYSAGVAGWQLVSDGNAELNNVVVRGKVVLPNAGVTNDLTGGTSAIRFWAGVEELNIANAPYKVLQDGSVIATKGTFGGTLTGDLNVGNIRIFDDNINPAYITIMTNSNALLKISLTELSALFNVPLNVGTSLVVDPVGNTLKTPARVEINEDVNNNIIFPNAVANPNQIEINNNGFNIKELAQALVFNSKRAGQTDFVFAKEGIADDVQVKIDGEIVVTDKLTLGNSYIQKRADGWDLMFS